MTAATFNAVKAVLMTDSTIMETDRARLLDVIRNDGANKTATAEAAPRLVRRAEAATRLSCSLRLVDKLAASGQLRKCTLPGRTRSCGFRESDLILLLNGKAAQ